eukprot:gene13379-14752_t
MFKESFDEELIDEEDHPNHHVSDFTANWRVDDAEEIRNSLVKYCQDVDI